MTLTDDLHKLSELHERKVLTDEEFARAKARVLNTDAGVRAHEPLVSAVNSFRRSRGDRVIGGVCGGLGHATGVESWVWRLIFVVLFICAGAGLLAYLLLWAIVPANADPAAHGRSNP